MCEMRKLRKCEKIIGVIILMALVIVVYFLFWRHAKTQFSVTFFNVGQGDAALIKFTNGQKMLVDCGPDKKILSKLGQSLPFFDKTLDYLIISHPDLDHYGGCVDVLNRYKVKQIITNGVTKEYDPYWQEWNKAAVGEQAINKIINGNELLTIASSTLEFFSPDSQLDFGDAKIDDNDKSIVFKLTDNNGKTFLFTGDMGAPLENVLLKKYCSNTMLTAAQATANPTQPPLGKGRGLAISPSYQEGARGELPKTCPFRSNILKVGHHGSNNSSGQEFLAAVKPKEAIISVGDNKFGHPGLRVIRHLERVGAQILRTDQTNDILIK